MQGKLINIRTDKFTKDEIKVIENCLKEWSYEWIVEIVYVGENNSESLEVCFTLEEDNLGEFFHVIFGCGYEFVYNQ
jgi:hypothetical protein